jgi:hypothetical protein
MTRRFVLVLCCGLVQGLASALTAAPITLVENGQPRAVIVVPDAKTARAAADDLRRYVERSSGARLEIVEEARLGSASAAGPRVFVGPCDATSRIVDLAKLQPEGFVIKSAGDDLFIVGRDATEAGLRVEGTLHGVCEFLERFVGVRWLMAGPLGEVVPKHATIRVPAVDVRQEPLLWQRRIRDSKLAAHKDRVRQILAEWRVPIDQWETTFAASQTRPWFAHQRLGGRVELLYGHAYSGWWNKYHEQHPDIFALQPNGTRINSPERERLCVSNPALWDLVAQEKVSELRARPQLTAASISPNDGGGGNKFCSCERCRAWDSPAAQAMYRANPKLDPGPGGIGPWPPLTDRYVRFYNEVARRVKPILPDRYLGCYAYSLYRTPPVGVDRMEDNLIVGYVGFSSYLNDQTRRGNREEWLQWSKVAKQLFLRPNLLWQPIGLPVNYVHKLAEDLRFLAEHGMRATDFDGGIGNWGTQGINYYVLARLLWDPHQPVDPILDDYCRAAYGAGAAAMQDYYRRLEALTDKIAAAAPLDASQRHGDINALTDYYTDAVLGELQHCVDRATQAIGASDPAARARAEMISTGLDYTRRTRDLLAAAEKVRQGKAKAEEFAPIHAATLDYYKSLALSWAVSIDHDYSYIRRGLSLRPGRAANVADPDAP